MDYYATLGLKRGASPEEIKKAYRSMAMKHHPDRGGDERKFKEVSTAYDVLSDPQKRQMYDMGVDPNQQQQGGFNQGPFEFHFGSGNFEDIFNFGFGGGFGRQPLRRNKSLSINVEITLEEVLTGKEINAEVGMPGRESKVINISIPAGIESGQQIRYEGMGDHSFKDMRPGDLLVNVIIRPHPRFRREGDSVIYEHTIDVWQAMLGTNIMIQTLDNRNLNISVPPGTQPDTVLSCKGEGLPNIRTRQRGNMLVKIKLSVPRNLSQSQIDKIQSLRNEI